MNTGQSRRRTDICIIEVATGRRIKANFRQLNKNDWRELLDKATEWGKCDYSPFFEIWAEDAGWRRDVRKVVLGAESDQRMQGILFLAGKGPLWPEGCVLVTAPWNRHGYESRAYAAVGTVLVAYLIEESFRRGKGGALRFQIDPDAQAFYESLGFEPLNPEMPDYYALKPEDAQDVFNRVRCSISKRDRDKRGVD
jgi:GNAT superfamily N-acetyltransferase